jgi:hypothetical protein
MLLTGDGPHMSKWISSPKAVEGRACRLGLIAFLVDLAYSQESQEKDVPSSIRSIPLMELCQMREWRVSMLTWPRRQWSVESVTRLFVTVAEAVTWCSTL